MVAQRILGLRLMDQLNLEETLMVVVTQSQVCMLITHLFHMQVYLAGWVMAQ